MKQVIQCSSCGSNSTFKIANGQYKCNYCQINFSVLEKKLENDEIKLSEFINQNQRTGEEVFQNAQKKSKPVLIFVTIAIALFGMGLAGSLIFIKQKTLSNSNFFSNKWQAPSIEKYAAYAGTNGPVIWLIYKQQTNTLDSAKYTLRIIDPISKKTTKQLLLGEMLWKNSFNWHKKFDYNFFPVKNVLYSVSEENGLQGFDIYTGKLIIDNKTLQTIFDELKNGIAEVKNEAYKGRCVLTTKDGNDYYYIYGLNAVKALDDEKNDHKEYGKNWKEQIYVTREKKSKLYLINVSNDYFSGIQIQNSFIEESDKISYSSSSNYYKSIKQLNDKIYAKAQPIDRTDSTIILFYASDFSKAAKGILECVNNKGISKWQLTDTIFNKFIQQNTSDNFYLDFNTVDKTLVINFSQAYYQSMGVNLETGKLVYTHSQSYNID
jgi:hypothetical protein